MIKRSAMHFDHYTMVPNNWARDTRLSRRARGLLTELLSHKPGWEVSLDHLVEAGPEGRDAIRSAIAELKELGYLQVVQQRAEAGRLAGYDYTLTDPWETSVGKPVYGSADVGESAGKKTISQEDQQSFGLEEDQLARKRATPHPTVFHVTAEMEAWARERYPHVDVQNETAKFSNYHLAKGSKFKQWPAAWRNWIIKAAEYQRQQQPAMASRGAYNMATPMDPYAGLDDNERGW